eukprot:2365150-Rhodomonas_salina.1
MMSFSPSNPFHAPRNRSLACHSLRLSLALAVSVSARVCLSRSARESLCLGQRESLSVWVSARVSLSRSARESVCLGQRESLSVSVSARVS